MSTQPTYGNPISVGTTRVFGWLPLPVLGSGVAAILLTAFIVMLGHILTGLIFLLVVVIILLIGFVPFGVSDQTLAIRIWRRFRHRVRVSNGEATFVNNHLSDKSPDELGRLPGYLSQIVPVSGRDGNGDTVDVLHHQDVGMLSVSLACSPVGADLMPQDQVNAQVGAFSGWLNSLSRDHGLVGAMLVVDSTRASARPLAGSIMERVAGSAPELSKQVLREATSSLPAEVSRVDTYATLGWQAAALGSNLDESVAEVLAKVPSQQAILNQAGAGSSFPMAEPEYADLMYTAYNPHRVPEVDRELYATDDHVIRTFQGTGPEYMDGTHKRVVLHDGVASMTVMVMEPDQAQITERSYARLFAPSRNFLRKRVAFFYRPIPVGKQRSTIDSASRGATTEATSKKRTTAFDTKKSKAAKAAAAQMSNGASLVQWQAMITVTFEPTQKAARAAENELKGIMAGMRWSFADYVPEAAFHQTLPLGVFPWVYAGSPKLWTGTSKRFAQDSNRN